MKKQRRSNKPKSSKKTQDPSPAIETKSRRDVLRLVRNGVIGVGVVGGGAAWALSAVRNTAYEQDLSRIGQGRPSVVQIHDPSCSMCTALQRETRHALKAFDDGALDYVVANIKTEEGQRFATEQGQSHVTLILMDPQGQPVRVLSGVQSRADLEQAFRQLVAAFR